MTLVPRISEDKAPVCAFGKLLLTVCQGSDIAILNGRSGKRSGCFTCHTSNGKSVVDYFLASSQLIPAVGTFCVEEISPASDHCPLTLTPDLQAQNPHDSEHTSQVQSAGSDASLLQIKYNVDKVEIFREALCNLLEPVFGVADPSGCLATVLYFTRSSCHF